MSAALLAGIAGLAAVDSLNPATLVTVTLILLGSRRQPVAEALSFVLGAFGSVLAVGLAIYLGADVAADTLDGALTGLRRAAFGLAALVLLVSALRALRPRRRKDIGLPRWFTAYTAVGLGVVIRVRTFRTPFPTSSPSSGS